jgi:hypothetical protein
VPPKERLRADEEGGPASARKRPADRRHEQPVAAAKARVTDLALKDHKLMAKDCQFDVAV